MKVGIMQPYFMPYLGYWQLINSVDTFVLLDDVNYINKGWVNRNEIKGGKFTIPLRGASQNKQIRELEIVDIEPFLRRVSMTYNKSPYFIEVFDLIDRRPLVNISQYIHSTILATCKYLGIQTKIIPTSSIFKPGKGQDRIISICKELGATEYVNPAGGKHLYDAEKFEDIKLTFMPESSGLSIIDNLMNGLCKL